MTTAAKPASTSRAAWRRLAFGLLIALAGTAQAQPQSEPGVPGDPPARVARVANVVGTAWVYDEEAHEWVQLLRNQTVAQGDHVRTDDASRLVLRIGPTSVYVDSRAEFGLPRLDEGAISVELTRGDLGVRLRAGVDVGDLRVITQQGQAVPERDGLYRVAQLDRGALLRTQRGRLRFESYRDSGPSWVEAGEQLEVWWAAGGQRAERQPLANDGFGAFVYDQSRQEGDLESTGFAQGYVSPEMTGAEDLDRYGAWDQSPDYGPVWVPAVVAVDWAPYRYGHWVWTRLWGWTWVDDAPWGFAPFHYGRWVEWHGRWCWAPGTYVRHPVYAPALVAWGGGPSVGVSVSVGLSFDRGRPPPRTGWVPLAPRQAFVPSYRHSDVYVERVNVGAAPANRGGNNPRAGMGQPMMGPQPAANNPNFARPQQPQQQQQQQRDDRWNAGRDPRRDDAAFGGRPQQQPQPQQQQPMPARQDPRPDPQRQQEQLQRQQQEQQRQDEWAARRQEQIQQQQQQEQQAQRQQQAEREAWRDRPQAQPAQPPQFQSQAQPARQQPQAQPQQQPQQAQQNRGSQQQRDDDRRHDDRKKENDR